jgi:arylsulfatase A-like enzyme
MIVVDTLRADHLGVYGYPKSTSPKVDEFAAQSFVFDRMYSQAPWTKPSIASLFTSLYPPQHLVLHEGTENQLADSLTTLAEVLKAAGYRTLAASQNPHVRANTGFSQGFDEFHGIPGYKSSIGEMVQKNMQFLNAAGEQPTFIYLHFLDPHGPYDPPPALRKKFIGEQQTDNLSVKRGRVAGLLKGEFPKKSIGPADLQYLEALYDAEIHSVDDSIGRILKQLQDHGVRENTLVIITADHGEEFLDHGTIKHGYQLFEEVIQIPLIFSVPGGIAGRNQSAIVEHVDLMPTVLDFLGIEAPSELQGRSLRSLLEDPATQTDRTAYIGSSWRGIERFAVRQGDWKLIRNEEQDKTTLYHLDGDPNEQHDVSAAHPEMVQKMLEDYRMTTQPISGVTPLSAIGDRDPELERALKSLGYLESDDSE